MEPKRAIEILTMFDENRWPGPAKDFDEALNLGIEALERQKRNKERFPSFMYLQLPSETMEADDAQSVER